MPDESVPSAEHHWIHDGRTTTFRWVGNTQTDLPVARVYAVAVTEQCEILLVGDGGGDENWWLPGGGIEPGESDEDALRRELLEEAGAIVEDCELLGYQRVTDPIEGSHLIGHYWARVRLPLVFEPTHEVTRTCSVPPENFLTYLFWSGDPAAQRLLELALTVEEMRQK